MFQIEQFLLLHHTLLSNCNNILLITFVCYNIYILKTNPSPEMFTTEDAENTPVFVTFLVQHALDTMDSHTAQDYRCYVTQNNLCYVT